MVDQRRDQEHQGLERNDLLSRLISANDSQSTNGLALRELLANIHIFLLAGHETTAHQLCVILGASPGPGMLETLSLPC